MWYPILKSVDGLVIVRLGVARGDPFGVQGGVNLRDALFGRYPVVGHQ
jgi:hypothetical protein